MPDERSSEVVSFTNVSRLRPLQLVDLKKPPMDVDSMLGADNPMSGILGAALGESKADTVARVEAAKKNANDLSGLVRRKAKKDDEPAPAPASDKAETETNGSKRKAEEPAESDGENSKKTKVDEAAVPVVAES